jgi:hypothetical protein
VLLWLARHIFCLLLRRRENKSHGKSFGRSLCQRLGLHFGPGFSRQQTLGSMGENGVRYQSI